MIIGIVYIPFVSSKVVPEFDLIFPIDRHICGTKCLLDPDEGYQNNQPLCPIELVKIFATCFLLVNFRDTQNFKTPTLQRR